MRLWSVVRKLLSLAASEMLMALVPAVADSPPESMAVEEKDTEPSAVAVKV